MSYSILNTGKYVTIGGKYLWKDVWPRVI